MGCFYCGGETGCKADCVWDSIGKTLDAFQRGEPYVAPKFWGCDCGYGMPEPIKTCVKCGANRQQPKEADGG